MGVAQEGATPAMCVSDLEAPHAFSGKRGGLLFLCGRIRKSASAICDWNLRIEGGVRICES